MFQSRLLGAYHRCTNHGIRRFALKHTKEQRFKIGIKDEISFTLTDVAKTLPSGSSSREYLFKSVNLSFWTGAKIGLIGRNGCGKSSLLKIIAGIDGQFEGHAETTSKDTTVGYLEQEPRLDESKTVSENILDGLEDQVELLRRFDEISDEMCDPECDFDKLMDEQAEVQTAIEMNNSWNLQKRVDIAIHALRCPPGDSDVRPLSGGEKRRISLAKLLISQPDILLLDEPTNHLDTESVSWLEYFLTCYPGTCIIITHDRYFLDNVAGYILEIHGGKASPFVGNYTDFIGFKASKLSGDTTENKRLKKILERELKHAQNRKKGDKAQLKQMDKIKDDLAESNQSVQTDSKGLGLIIPPGPPLGDNVIDFKNVTFQFHDADTPMFSNLTFSLPPKSVLGVIGPNGAGKSTLIKLITGDLPITSGDIEIGETVELGYISQMREGHLNPDAIVWQEICGGLNEIRVSEYKTITARNYVAQFNFRQNDQNKRVGDLSGGERNRAQLAKSLIQGCNVLLLDEPSNDLDVATLRSLEESLMDFSGAAIVVSHDRWFLNRVATHILSFEDDKVSFFQGNYEQYQNIHKSEEQKKWSVESVSSFLK